MSVETSRTSLAASPYAATVPTPDLMLPGQNRPTGLTVVGVLSIVGGLIGLMSGLFGLINLIFGEAMSSAFVMPGPQQAAQERFNEQIQLVNQRYLILNIVASAGNFIIGTGLFLGGMGIFRNPAKMRSLLRATLLAAILLECVKGVSYVLTQLAMMPIMADYMSEMMSAQGAGNAPAGFTQMMSVFAWIGIAMWAVWALVKIGLYLWGHAYLNRPRVLEYYGESDEAELARTLA